MPQPNAKRQFPGYTRALTPSMSLVSVLRAGRLPRPAPPTGTPMHGFYF